MAQNDSGILKLENGNYEYRFVMVVNGKKVSQRKRKDEFGNPLTTKRAAIKARNAAMKRAEMEATHEEVRRRVTVEEVYKEYCEKGRTGKAYQTVRKQDSLWKNHIKSRFGSRYVDDISTAEVEDYLAELYYVKEYAYKYTESFLKMFYLIFGQAYSREYLDVDRYSKLCMNKGTKISMPKMKGSDEDDIVVFSMEELDRLDEYFRGSNGETAYMLGKYGGLRINECYGLRWENVNLEEGTISLDQQMQYQDGVVKLVPLKTRNAKRTIRMNQKLKVYFQNLARQHKIDEIELQEARQQKQTFITDMNGSSISSLELVNTLPNGKLQTVNSMKYHSRTIKQKLGIDFKFHYLRHTYGTRMAELNTPQHLLCNQMGHASVRVTQKYYIGMTQTGIDVMDRNLNLL